MKKMLFLSTSILLTSTINLSTANAHYFKAEPVIDRTIYMEAAKKILASEADRSALVSLKTLNAKAGRNFEKSYQGASDIRVYNQNNHIFVHFKQDGIKHRVHYKKGWQMSLIRYYSKDLLDNDVTRLITDQYPEYIIKDEIIEVTVGDKMAHLVLIESCTSFKRIKVVEGETEVYEQFRKP